MADAVRRCRWIAVDINAAAFTLLLVGPPGEKRRLIPSFDSDYPGQSALTRPLAAQIGEWAADRAVVSTIPCWWSAASETRSHASFVSLAWAEGPVAGPAGTLGDRLSGLCRSRPGRAGGVPRRRDRARQRHDRRHPCPLLRAVCRRDPAEAGRRRQHAGHLQARARMPEPDRQRADQRGDRSRARACPSTRPTSISPTPPRSSMRSTACTRSPRRCGSA